MRFGLIPFDTRSCMARTMNSLELDDFSATTDLSSARCANRKLAGLKAVSFDSKFIHARPQGAGIDPEELRGPLLAVDHPTGFSQGPHDVIAFYVFECIQR